MLAKIVIMTLLRALVSVKPSAVRRETRILLVRVGSGLDPIASYFAGTGSGLSMPDGKRRQMARDIVGIERRARERADRIERFRGLAGASKRRIKEIRPEHAHRGFQRFRAVSRLSPAH